MAGVSQLLSSFRRGGSKGGVTAVEFRPEGIALAHLESRFGGASISQCLFLPGESVSNGAPGLKDMVKSLGLSSGECILVLAPTDYRLALIDAPDVPQSELKDALRWKIGDLIDFPVDQAAIDVFMLPEKVQRGDTKSVFVVATNREQVRPMLTCLEECGLPTECIDISHLAFRNLIARISQPEQATALLIPGDRQSQLMIVRDGEIYLARPVNFTSRILNREDNQREIAITQLVGDLKRSLDYFEIQLRQDPVVDIAVVPVEEGTDFLVERLNANIAAEVYALNIPDIVPCDASLPALIQHHCGSAVGGALRAGGAV